MHDRRFRVMVCFKLIFGTGGLLCQSWPLRVGWWIGEANARNSTPQIEFTLRLARSQLMDVQGAYLRCGVDQCLYRVFLMFVVTLTRSVSMKGLSLVRYPTWVRYVFCGSASRFCDAILRLWTCQTFVKILE